MEPAVGIEPTTDGLQNRCSAAELSWLKRSGVIVARLSGKTTVLPRQLNETGVPGFEHRED
jgi:hypothetical protein